MLMIMKKEQMELKELIKEAILEAFAEMYGVATMTEGQPDVPQPDGENNGDGSGSNNGNNGNNGNGDSNGGSNTAANSGGTPNNGRPKPDVGVGTWSRR